MQFWFLQIVYIDYFILFLFTFILCHINFLAIYYSKNLLILKGIFLKIVVFHQVDQMTFTNNCKPKCMLSFPSDRTIETLQVILTGTEFARNSPVLRKSITLDNGMQQFLSGNDSFVYKSEVPAYVITVQNPQVICLCFFFCLLAENCVQTFLSFCKEYFGFNLSSDVIMYTGHVHN